MSPRSSSRFERLEMLVASKLVRAFESTEGLFRDDSGQPVGTVKKSPEDQLADYLRMTPDEESQLRALYGDEEIEKYITKMEKLRTGGVWPTEIATDLG